MFERGPIRGASAAREKCAAKDDFGARNGLQPVSRSKIVLRGALFPSGACAPNWTAFEHRSCDCPAVFCNPTTRAWWTGKDSHLRSPQGAADLQSAGCSHSPTRPEKSFWDANHESRTYPSTTCKCSVQKHKKDSCQETPARSFFTAGFAPPRSPENFLVELAEGIEPPTL